MARKNKTSKGTKHGFHLVWRIKDFIDDVKYSVLNFEDAPLLNASFLATTLALVLSIPSFIVSMVLAINNITLAARAAVGNSSGFKFLSAGTLYYGSIPAIFFVLLFVVACILLVVYKVKHPVRKGGLNIKWLMKYWAMSALVMLVVLPLVLLFAENIVVIVCAVLTAILGFAFLTSVGEGSSSQGSPSQSKGKSSESNMNDYGNAMIKKVPKKFPVFRGETAASGKGMFFYNNTVLKEVRYICSQSDYDRGKCRIVNAENTNQDHVISSRIPAGAEPQVCQWIG